MIINLQSIEIQFSKQCFIFTISAPEDNNIPLIPIITTARLSSDTFGVLELYLKDLDPDEYSLFNHEYKHFLNESNFNYSATCTIIYWMIYGSLHGVN